MHSESSVAAVVVCIIFPVLASVAVFLRIYAQNLKGHSLRADDHFIAAGLAITLALCAMSIYGACDGGLGWPSPELIGPIGITFAKLVFAGQILWAAAITMIRTGLLLFYRRIFITKRFRLANTIMIGINAAWFITNFFGTIFSYSWDRKLQNTINYPVWLITQGALNMTLDVATLCLPLFVIRTLQISTARKFMLAGIFWLGIFCVIASIVRLVYFVELSSLAESDRQFSNTTFYCYIWSVIEPCSSIIAACLPTFRPLLKEGRSLQTLIHSVRSMFSLSSRSQNVKIGSNSNSNSNSNGSSSRNNPSNAHVSRIIINKDITQDNSAYASQPWQDLSSTSTELLPTQWEQKNGSVRADFDCLA